jgi:hypothetical protein
MENQKNTDCNESELIVALREEYEKKLQEQHDELVKKHEDEIKKQEQKHIEQMKALLSGRNSIVENKPVEEDDKTFTEDLFDKLKAKFKI